MSPTPQQRAQILYLRQVEGSSIVIIAVMTGLSRSAVRRVLHQALRQEGPAVEKAAAMRPSSKGHVERQLHDVHAHLLRKGTS